MLGDHVALVCLLLLMQGLQAGSVLRHRRLDDPESPGGCPARDLAPQELLSYPADLAHLDRSVVQWPWTFDAAERHLDQRYVRQHERRVFGATSATAVRSVARVPMRFTRSTSWFPSTPCGRGRCDSTRIPVPVPCRFHVPSHTEPPLIR